MESEEGDEVLVPVPPLTSLKVCELHLQHSEKWSWTTHQLAEHFNMVLYSQTRCYVVLPTAKLPTEGLYYLYVLCYVC